MSTQWQPEWKFQFEDYQSHQKRGFIEDILTDLILDHLKVSLFAYDVTFHWRSGYYVEAFLRPLKWGSWVISSAAPLATSVTVSVEKEAK